MKTTIKAAVTVAFTTIFSFLGILATPIFLLLRREKMGKGIKVSV